ncbi:transporter [Flavobacterium sp. TSSA_36]|uniref:transporter n=1 Tax=Flavobacterium sp. TSSA_36 TaxID=3447669 RepID=UPI003F395444
MKPLKTFFLFACGIVPFLQYGQYTDQINSNRPGETMSAYGVGKHVIQMETGVYGITSHHNLLNYDVNGFGLDATLRWGAFLERLEVIADIQYQNDQYVTNFSTVNRANLRQTILGAKYLVYDPFKNYEKKINLYSWKANQRFNWRQLLPAVSVYAGANFVFSGNPYAFSLESSISPKAMLITQNHLGDGRWVFVTNIIADYIGTDYPSYGYVVTLTRGFSKKWSGFIENQGYNSDFYSDMIVRGGAAYLLNDHFQIDASVSTNFKDTPSFVYGGFGISWRYDGFYKNAQASNNPEKQSRSKKKKSQFD